MDINILNKIAVEMVKENIKEYSVSEISSSIKNALEDSFGYVRVRGEISGLQQPSSGHMY